MHQRIVEAKQHLKDHKRDYTIGVTSLVVGGVGVCVFGNRGAIVQKSQNIALLVWKPTTNQVQIVLERRACNEPMPVRYKLTGEPFASINRAAQVTGWNKGEIAADVKGVAEHFEKLPDSILAK